MLDYIISALYARQYIISELYARPCIISAQYFNLCLTSQHIEIDANVAYSTHEAPHSNVARSILIWQAPFICGMLHSNVECSGVYVILMSQCSML